MPRCRYVVLHHEGIAEPHFDFMFETSPGSETLRTFRLSIWPMTDSLNEQEAVELALHRRAYLTYEGPVSGDRGTVRRVEEGEFDAQLPAEGLARSIELKLLQQGGCYRLLKQAECSWKIARQVN